MHWGITPTPARELGMPAVPPDPSFLANDQQVGILPWGLLASVPGDETDSEGRCVHRSCPCLGLGWVWGSRELTQCPPSHPWLQEPIPKTEQGPGPLANRDPGGEPLPAISRDGVPRQGVYQGLRRRGAGRGEVQPGWQGAHRPGGSGVHAAGGTLLQGA